MTEPERDIFFLEGVDDYWSPASSAGDCGDDPDEEDAVVDDDEGGESS